MLGPSDRRTAHKRRTRPLGAKARSATAHDCAEPGADARCRSATPAENSDTAPRPEELQAERQQDSACRRYSAAVCCMVRRQRQAATDSGSQLLSGRLHAGAAPRAPCALQPPAVRPQFTKRTMHHCATALCAAHALGPRAPCFIGPRPAPNCIRFRGSCNTAVCCAINLRHPTQTLYELRCARVLVVSQQGLLPTF